MGKSMEIPICPQCNHNDDVVPIHDLFPNVPMVLRDSKKKFKFIRFVCVGTPAEKHFFTQCGDVTL